VSYYHAKKTAEAKRYLDDRDREVAIQIVDERRQRSIAWLEKFRASGRASRTGFDWRPRWALQPPGDDNGKEIIEGEFAVMADADAESEGRGQSGQAEGGGDAPQAGGGHAQRDARESESDFTEEDRTPF
jgi:hypothetical protein